MLTCLPMTTSQIIFTILVVAAFGFFFFTMGRILRILFRAKKEYRWDKIGERLWLTLLVAFGQTKMMRKPIAGILHAIVWWGFLVITIGTVELIIDGITGKERVFSGLGLLYDVITASAEIFAALVIVACVVFLIRRYFIKPRRFSSKEMKPKSRIDATMILTFILVLMVSLLLMNLGYLGSEWPREGAFPVSMWLFETFDDPLGPDYGVMPIYRLVTGETSTYRQVHDVNWWIHITGVLVFLNILPYSKHFHVIMAVPNVFFSRLTPKAKLNSMPEVTKEVRAMLNLPAPPAPKGGAEVTPPKFGVKEVSDVTWKNVLDSYTCTECGRCTEVCPANNTGKLLSPRKLYMDLRRAVNESAQTQNPVSLVTEQTPPLGDGGLISPEELWACTTCMACVQECPVDIDHVPFIVDMRRNLVLEESKPPQELAMMFSNIENNGAPWAFSPEDRLKWAEGMDVPVMSEVVAQGNAPEILFWVGCAGSFDERAQRITRAFAKLLIEAGVSFAVLGKEESCNGDPAKRAGNEFLYQVQALQNIEKLKMYNVKKIVTACPHCFNILKNEYPDLGGNYEVVHHSQFLEQLLREGKLKLTPAPAPKGEPALDTPFRGSGGSNGGEGSRVTYHDSCYLGRGNDVYEEPRFILQTLNADIVEMERSRSRGMCCGAGGAQMFKEEEPGSKRVSVLRTEHAMEVGAKVIATACPFCMTMMSDGVKLKDQQDQIRVLDIAELLVAASPALPQRGGE